MYVTVIPAVRSIRGKDEFIYAVPSDTVPQVGQIVEIPWRSQIVPGIIWKTNVPKPKFPTKDISAYTDQMLPESYVRWIEWFSEYYYIAKSHVAKMIIPERPRRSGTVQIDPLPRHTIAVSKDRVPVIQDVVTQLVSTTETIQTILYARSTEAVAVVRGVLRSTKQRIAIIVAEEHELEQWAAALYQLNPVMIHSRLGKHAMYNAWHGALTNSARVYIGTKRLSVFPLQQFDTVIVIDPENKAHKQWDLNPRYSVPRVVQAQLKDTKTKLVFFTQSPPVELIAMGTPVNTLLCNDLVVPAVTLIDMTSERFDYNQSLLSRSAWQRCAQDATIFLWLNKKGSGSFLICKTCDELLADIHTTRCSKCRGIDLVKRGLGTTSLTSLLRKQFPERHVIELTKDTGNVHIPYDAHPIIVGTIYAEQQLEWKRVDTIIVVSIDHMLSQPEFRASEVALQTLVHLRNTSQCLYIQTYAPNHLVFRALAVYYPQDWYTQEINNRQEFFIPPFGTRVWIRNTETNEERILHSLDDIPTAAEWIIDREL